MKIVEIKIQYAIVPAKLGERCKNCSFGVNSGTLCSMTVGRECLSGGGYYKKISHEVVK